MVLGLAIVAGVALVTVLLVRGDSGPEMIEPLAVQAETPRFASLAALTAAADAVVIAQVTAIREGRLVGETNGGIRTRLVELTVERLLAGEVNEGTIVLEEEGWLADGTPIIVNGMVPSEIGDLGFYFLFRGRSDEFPHYALIGEQGRYLVDVENGSLSGSERDVGLSEQITARNAAELERRIVELASAD